MAWIYQHPFSKYWWIGYRVNGVMKRRSTKTTDRAKADQELAKHEAIDQAHKAGSLTDEFVALLTRKTSSSDTLRGYIKQWLAECKDLSEATLKKYRAIPEEFCTYLNATESAPLLRDVRHEAVSGFIRAKRANTSTATAKHVRRVLSAFFNYAVDNQALPVSPVLSPRAMKLTKTGKANREDKSARRAFNMVELKTIFDKCPSDFWRYMVMAGFYSGQRMGDLICLVWGAVDFEKAQISLTQFKTGKNVTVPLRAELGAFLKKLRDNAGTVKPADPIWPAESERYQKFGAGGFSNEFYDDVLLPAGLVTPRKQSHHKKKDGAKNGRRKVNAVSFHCLRHTFVTLLKISGASQATAKELAGHSSDAVSDLYTHIPSEVLNQAITKLPAIQPEATA